MDNYNKTENTIFSEFKKTIWKKFRKTINDYDMIKDGDKIAVCISGGKDSMLLALCIQRLKKNNEINFDTEYIIMNPGYPEESLIKIRSNCELLGIPAKIYDTNIFDSAMKSPKNPCFLCSRLRRGSLYAKAQELNCNKIALGHHFDDVVETILMAMLYGSQTQTMLPRLKAKNYDVEVIRPLYMIRESDIISWTDYNNLDFCSCSCPVSAEKQKDSKRAEIKSLLAEQRIKNPDIDMNIFRSVENIDLERIISYHNRSEYHSFIENL
ncbi:MAG: tRNA 2-thiocytidine biosynthesis protein TtcA [Ruminococcus sp.]|nr:tRNA 2-thiocytidine biosynthesis protein TtcA [Ruminococcus sp.]